MRVLLATSLVLALGVGTAQAAPTVVVKPDGEDKRKINLDELNPDTDGDYKVRNNQGTETVTVDDGYSLKEVLNDAQVDITTGHVVISHGGRGVFLDRPNFRKGELGDGPPVFDVDENGAVTFIRPRRTNSDLNARDRLTAIGASDRIRITERTQPLLKLTIDASATEIEPGETVDVTAELRQPSGRSFEEDIQWTASGKVEPKSGEAVTYTFHDDENVVIDAQYDAEGDGVAEAQDSVDIVVGDPVDSDQDQTGGGTNTNNYAPDYGPYYGDTGAGTNDYTNPSNTNDSLIPDTPAGKTALPAETGEEISGELLSETGVYVPPPPEELLGVRSGTPDEGTNWTVPGIALGGTLVVGLLGFGAGREFEQLDIRRLRNLLPV